MLSRQSRNNAFENRLAFAQRTFKAKRYETVPAPSVNSVRPQNVTMEEVMRSIVATEAKKKKKKKTVEQDTYAEGKKIKLPYT